MRGLKAYQAPKSRESTRLRLLFPLNFFLCSSCLLLLYNKTKLRGFFICYCQSFDIKRGRFTLEIIVIWIICCSRPNRGQFSPFHILSALCCSFEKWNALDDEVKNIPLLFSISDRSILFENQWQVSSSVQKASDRTF